MWIISGNTYPVRQALKELGCRWSPKDKSWIATDKQMMYEANDIVYASEQRKEERKTSINTIVGRSKRKGKNGGQY